MTMIWAMMSLTSRMKNNLYIRYNAARSSGFVREGRCFFGGSGDVCPVRILPKSYI